MAGVGVGRRRKVIIQTFLNSNFFFFFTGRTVTIKNKHFLRNL